MAVVSNPIEQFEIHNMIPMTSMGGHQLYRIFVVRSQADSPSRFPEITEVLQEFDSSSGFCDWLLFPGTGEFERRL